MFRSFILLAAGLLCSAGVAFGDDLVRLDGKGDDAEVQEARYRGWGGGWGGYHRGYYGGRSYWGGGYGWGRGYGYGWGGYRHHHHYYGGWGRPYSYYRPMYSYYYSPYSYYSAPVYYSTPSYYFSPCAADTSTVPQATTLALTQAPSYAARTTSQVLRSQPNSDGTYRYDGGPRSVVPMPGESAPAAIPVRPTLPRDGRLVSIPASSSGNRYLAYGEKADTRPETTPVRRATSDLIPVSLPSLGEAGESFSGGTMIFTQPRRQS